MGHEGRDVSKKQFSDNFAEKLLDKNFVADIGPLLSSGFTWEINGMAALVNNLLIERLKD